MSGLTVEQDFSAYMARIGAMEYSGFSPESERKNCQRCAREDAHRTKREYSILLHHIRLSNRAKSPIWRDLQLKTNFALLNRARAEMVRAYKVRRWLLRQIAENPEYSAEWVNCRKMAENATRRENMPKSAYPSAYGTKPAEKAAR